MNRKQYWKSQDEIRAAIHAKLALMVLYTHETILANDDEFKRFRVRVNELTEEIDNLFFKLALMRKGILARKP